jgi:hypothetical protein
MQFFALPAGMDIRGKVHDSNIPDGIVLDASAYYAMDL